MSHVSAVACPCSVILAKNLDSRQGMEVGQRRRCREKGGEKGRWPMVGAESWRRGGEVRAVGAEGAERA